MNSDEFDERGYFWWADDPVLDGHFAPETAVPGQIVGDASGTTKLILDGILPRKPGGPDLNPGSISSNEPQLAVVGLIKEGLEYVRLEQLSFAGYSFGSSRPSSESFRARSCVRGHRLISDIPPNRYCTSIRLSLAGFEEWQQLQPPKFENGRTSLTVCFPQGREDTFELDSAMIAIGVDVDYETSRPQSEITVRQEGYITYTPRTPMTLEDVRDTVRKLEDLLVLLTNCERSIGFPRVRIAGDDHWFPVRYETMQRVEKAVTRSELWTTFPDLLSSFGRIANAWFEKSDKFGPAFHLYLGNRRGVRLYVEHRFVNLVWGLEAFHHSSGGNVANPALSQKIERILTAIDESELNKEDRRWLRRVLKHEEKPKLSQRIFEVLAQLPLGFDKKELEDFSGMCAAERNLISHFGGRHEADSYETHLNNWARISYALDPLYHARILQELEFTDEAIRKIFWDPFRGAVLREVLRRNQLRIPENKPVDH